MEDQVAEKIEKLYIEPATEMTSENVTLDSETGSFEFDDAAATKLVLDDVEYAENFLNVLQWAAGWSLADTLYQSPASASAFDGGNVAMANVPKFLLSNHISSIVPKITQSIFYEDPPFLLRPRPGTGQDIIRAKTALFSYQFSEMEFEEEAERTIDQRLIGGLNER